MKFTIPKVKGRSNIGSEVFFNFINGIKFARASSMQTRSFGEDDYSSFGDWFMKEIWPDAEDGDRYTMHEDENGWYLEDQDGNRYDIPDGVGSGSEDDQDEDMFPDWSEPDDSGFDDGYGDDDSSLGIAVYCPHCGTYLGSMLLEGWENGLYYCPRCKKYVSIFFG